MSRRIVPSRIPVNNARDFAVGSLPGNQLYETGSCEANPSRRAPPRFLNAGDFFLPYLPAQLANQSSFINKSKTHMGGEAAEGEGTRPSETICAGRERIKRRKAAFGQRSLTRASF